MFEAVPHILAHVSESAQRLWRGGSYSRQEGRVMGGFCWSERFDHAHDAVTCRPNEDVSPRRQMR